MSGHFTFTGTLTRVKISEDGKTVNLIFPYMQWNFDLQKECETSMSIMVSEQHMGNLGEYRAYQGKIVSIPCRPMVSNKSGQGKMFYMTAADGKLLTD